jgi:hypothetical protein
MCRRVPERILIPHFNDKVIACVNTGIVLSCIVPTPQPSLLEDLGKKRGLRADDANSPR